MGSGFSGFQAVRSKFSELRSLENGVHRVKTFSQGQGEGPKRMSPGRASSPPATGRTLHREGGRLGGRASDSESLGLTG